MKKEITKLLLMAFILIGIQSCKKEEEPEEIDQPASHVPEFYLEDNASTTPQFTLIADASQSINIPQDLDFHPHRAGELWVINKDTEQTGGSTVTITNAGKPDQETEWRRDGNAWHFMSLPAAMAFSENGNWASSHNIQDGNHQGGTFAGPSLWSSDMEVYARPSGANGSHLDMLHSSPYSMGIAAEQDNVFWVSDTYYGHIVRYDFVEDHGPGNHDHSDGRVHRYMEIDVKRNPMVPGHLILDQNKKWLYVVDAGNQRVIKVNIQSGTKSGDIPPINEPLAQHWEMENAEWEVFKTSGFVNPCGIEVNEDRLFVSDYETGEIIAYNVHSNEEIARIDTGEKGICGIKIGPDGKIWYVNALTNQVMRVNPQ